MERIKEALNEARAERDRHRAPEAGDDSVVRRMRLFPNFAQLGDEGRRTVLAAGNIVEVRPGQAICTIGGYDPHVHYLIEGALNIVTPDGVSRTVYAGDGPARHALDEAGEKTASLIVLHDARVFRITPERLAAALEAVESQPLPTAEYTETFTGQQLAKLVGALRTEHRGLNEVVAEARGPAEPLEVLVGDRTLGVDIDLGMPDLDSTRGPVPVHDETDVEVETGAARAVTAPPPADALTDMMRAFEGELRRHLETIRAEERARATGKLKSYAAKLKLQAEEQLRAKLKTVRSRYESSQAAREQDLRKRYEQLLALANRLTRQKAEIYQARHQIEEKLKRAEQLHRELAELGGLVTTQLDQIDEMLPADDSDLTRLRAESGE